jgi:hypothetical protein
LGILLGEFRSLESDTAHTHETRYERGPLDRIRTPPGERDFRGRARSPERSSSRRLEEIDPHSPLISRQVYKMARDLYSSSLHSLNSGVKTMAQVQHEVQTGMAQIVRWGIEERRQGRRG